MARLKVISMERRVEFVLRRKEDNESMTELCRRFHISRKTGYLWWHRYRRYGLNGLRLRSRRPRRSPRQTAAIWIRKIRRLHKQFPHWGSKKLRAMLLRRARSLCAVPARSTIWRIMHRHQGKSLCKRRARRTVVRGRPLRAAQCVNEVWTVDFKGRFRTRDGRWCEPLTVVDLVSRYVLEVRSLPDQTTRHTQRVFLKLFRKYGIPACIRCDNGGPFASTGAGGLSRLSAWWKRLGIDVEWITPGHPEQNGAHERMHRTLKAETLHRPAANLRTQQRRFDRWRRQFNYQRPHEALGMKTPAELYRRSTRRYPKRLKPIEYSAHSIVRMVRSNGEIKWRGRKQFIGDALVGMPVGLTAVGGGQYRVHFGLVLLGELHDNGICRFHPVVTRPDCSREKFSSPLGGRKQEKQEV